ncbi:MAG: C40 family peptidase [Pseudomonadota bacterium]|nr:C40 family peptidase [Pseudomonadota bacterium]
MLSGRPAATCRPRHRGLSLLLATVLAAVASPAMAGPGLAADSADQMRLASASQALVDASLPVTGSLLFASDVNQLIAAQASPAAQPEAAGGMQTVLKRALALLGTPYRWGGNSPDAGFDCSGLVGYVFRTALGIELPRVSRDMANDGVKVERTALTAGDLVFFSRRGQRVDHVGIYLGNGQFVHAPRTGKDVMVSELDTGYWSGRFLQARRVAGI